MDEDTQDAVGRLLAEVRARAAAPAVGPARRLPTEWRERVPRAAVLLGAVLVVGLAGVLVFVRHGGDAARPPDPLAAPRRAAQPSNPPPTTGAPSPPPPARLDSLVPAAWRRRCRVSAVRPAGADAAIVCDVGGAADRVELRRYRDGSLLGTALAALARDVVAGGPDAQPRCANGAPENRAWRRPSAAAIAGRYVCRLDAAGAQLAWSDTTRGVLVQATRADGDLAALFAWWTRAPL